MLINIRYKFTWSFRWMQNNRHHSLWHHTDRPHSTPNCNRLPASLFMREISPKPPSCFFEAATHTAIFINVNRYNLTLNLASALSLETWLTETGIKRQIPESQLNARSEFSPLARQRKSISGRDGNFKSSDRKGSVIKIWNSAMGQTSTALI